LLTILNEEKTEFKHRERKREGNNIRAMK